MFEGIATIPAHAKTVAFFQDTAVAIAILEMTEPVLLRYVGHGQVMTATSARPSTSANLRKYRQHYTWTTTRDPPCDRLRIGDLC